MVIYSKLKDIHFFGGRLSLDFINTVHDRTEEPVRDYLHNILDVIEWARMRKVITVPQSRELASYSLQNLEKGNRCYLKAMELREFLYTIFSKVSAGEELHQDDLARLTKDTRNALSFIHLTSSAGMVSEVFCFPKNNYDAVLAPVIRDAHVLLLQNLQHRIRSCPSCGWLFLDTTRNGKRRWCSMKMCGSNAKALDWYHRHKK